MGSIVKPYNNVFDAFIKIIRKEGITAIQKGFSSAFLYQIIMNGLRLGLIWLFVTF